VENNDQRYDPLRSREVIGALDIVIDEFISDQQAGVTASRSGVLEKLYGHVIREGAIGALIELRHRLQVIQND
jgi:hypothetical protein